MRGPRDGCSLIELTLAVLGLCVLGLIAFATDVGYLEVARRAASRTEERKCRSAEALYRFDHVGRAPASGRELESTYVLRGGSPCAGGR